MRKFNVNVNGTVYTVEVEEVGGAVTAAPAAPAVDAHLVCLVSLAPCLGNVPAHSSSARIHVLEPHAKRRIELPNDIERRIGILYTGFESIRLFRTFVNNI